MLTRAFGISHSFINLMIIFVQIKLQSVVSVYIHKYHISHLHTYTNCHISDKILLLHLTHIHFQVFWAHVYLFDERSAPLIEVRIYVCTSMCGGVLNFCLQPVVIVAYAGELHTDRYCWVFISSRIQLPTFCYCYSAYKCCIIV